MCLVLFRHTLKYNTSSARALVLINYWALAYLELQSQYELKGKEREGEFEKYLRT